MGKKTKKKGQGAEKTAQKTEKKLTNKMKKELRLNGEEDIEKIVAEMEREEQDRQKVQEIPIKVITRRDNFSLIAHPDKDQLILFGGEWFDGRMTQVFRDFLFYNIPTNTWTAVQMSGAPPPRSGHQMVATSANGGQLYLFGGEYTNSSRNQFYHYSDLWVYHLSKKRWEKITAPNGPSARSGHRMVLVKKKIFLFGGFHDYLKHYRYHNDVYTFDIETYQWAKLSVSNLGAPTPRSSCLIAPLNDGRILIYGGYSKETLKNDVDKGIVHTDSFILGQDAVDSKWKWQSVKIGGYRFSPRCSISNCLSPNNSTLYCFGGVFDIEDDEENLTGKFYNDFFLLDIQNLVWRTISISSPKIKEKDITDEIETPVKMEVEESVPESTIISDDGIFKVTVGPSVSASNSVLSSIDKAEHFQPCPRIHAGLVVKKGILYLYGGMFEKGDKQITLSDFYSIDIRKFDEWKTLIKDNNSEEAWLGSEDESSSSTNSDSGEELEDSD